MHAHYAVARAWDDGAHGELPAGQEGLAIVIARADRSTRARCALPEPRPADARMLLSAQRRRPTAGPIWVHTTHLHYRLDDGVAREHQVLAIDAAIRGCGRDNDERRRRSCAATSTRRPTPTRSASCAA